MKYDVEPVQGFHPEIGLLLAALQDSTREWRDELGAPSVEAIVWQPAPGMHSIGAELLHIADVELYWFAAFAAGLDTDEDTLKLTMSEETQQYQGLWPVPHAQTIEWYFGLHDRLRARAWEAIRGIDPKREYRRPNGETFTLRWIVAHVVEHDSYHGGQAVLLHELWKRLRAA